MLLENGVTVLDFPIVQLHKLFLPRGASLSYMSIVKDVALAWILVSAWLRQESWNYRHWQEILASQPR